MGTFFKLFINHLAVGGDLRATPNQQWGNTKKRDEASEKSSEKSERRENGEDFAHDNLFM